MRMIHGFHPVDDVAVRLAPNDTGSVIVISNRSTGMSVLLAVPIDLVDAELIDVHQVDA
jgi:hypothetical protein